MKRTAIFIILVFSVAFGIKAQRIDYKKVKNAEQHVVYHQNGRFAGWPANNGSWIFDNDEILIGFTEAPYEVKEGHNLTHPYSSWLARSKDGGETWHAWDPEGYVGDFGDQPELKKVEKPINFHHEKFAIRVVGTAYHGANDPRGHFFYSYDGGKSWNGPYGFGNLRNHPQLTPYWEKVEITSRTDYIVTGKHECLLFMSARPEGKFGTDRLFCMKTSDGGKTFQFQGWIVKPYKESEVNEAVKVDIYSEESENPWSTQCRAVMSESFLLPGGKILSVMRRKYVPEEGKSENWVDAYVSNDGGKTWTFQSRVGDAGDGNGNPPALTLMQDGRMCAVYGERAYGTIQVAYSSDQGRTWSEPRILYDNFWNEDNELNDLGYPRVVCRSDGRMVTMFYYSTREKQGQIHATIWRPRKE